MAASGRSTCWPSASGCEALGPQKAWEQASETIGQLYDGRYHDECLRYCRMVLTSAWAGREARAEACLRVICCHRQCDREGAVHPLSERLMREHPSTRAARWHAKAAAGWLEAYLRDDEAVALLDRMTALHKGHADFVRQCCLEAASICRRVNRYDHLATYVATLKALAAREDGINETLRTRCAQDAARLVAVAARARARDEEKRTDPRAPK